MKKFSFLLFISLLFCFSTSCKKDKKEGTTEIEEVKESSNSDVKSAGLTKKITVRLEPKSDSKVTGNAIFRQDEAGVTMVAVFGGLSEGKHAIHLHEKADCSADDGTSSGGHWNPTKSPHGKWGDAAGYHKGDIGNFTADAKGNGTINFSTDEWCIGCGDPNKDILGKAVIVHQGEDDFTSQPTGAAGGRISCGGIIQ